MVGRRWPVCRDRHVVGRWSESLGIRRFLLVRGRAQPCRLVVPAYRTTDTMDNVTHTLFALTLARTPLGRAGRGTTAALVLASNAPDIDIVATIGGAASY